jgi:hypothetical protein
VISWKNPVSNVVELEGDEAGELVVDNADDFEIIFPSESADGSSGLSLLTFKMDDEEFRQI